MSKVANPQMAAAIDAITAGHVALLEAGVTPANGRDAIVCIKELETLRRAADAACVDLIAAIEREHLHRLDGHATAKAMVRHHARLSGGEAAARQRSMRVSLSCPDIGDAYRTGRLGTDQIRQLLHDALEDDKPVDSTDAESETFEKTPLDPDTSICRSLDGVALDPTETFSTTLVAKIRRVLIDARSTVVDLGVARFFTGNARHAVKIASTTCVWPGCHTPSSACEADHLDEHGRGGRTNPGNGAPLCGKHNRWKQKGFTVWRDPAGRRCSTQSNSRNSKSSQWHTDRPDGTEIPN